MSEFNVNKGEKVQWNDVQLNLIDKWTKEIDEFGKYYAKGSAKYAKYGRYSNILLKTFAALSGAGGLGAVLANVGQPNFWINTGLSAMNLTFTVVGAAICEYNFMGKADSYQSTAGDCEKFVNYVEELKSDNDIDVTECAKAVRELRNRKDEIITGAARLSL